MIQQLPDATRQKTSDSLNVPYGSEANQQPILYPVNKVKQTTMPYTTVNQRLVGAQPLERGLGDSVHVIPSPHSSRRHLEGILPSIEDDSPRVRDQLGVSGRHIEHSSLSFQTQNALVRAAGIAPQSLRLTNDWDQLDTKRRKVEGFTSYSRGEPPLLEAAYESQKTVLIPLRNNHKEHMTSWQPAQPGYGTGRRPLREEMMLSHRMEAIHDSDRQRPSQITHISNQGTSQKGHFVDAEKPKYASREHFQIQLSRAVTGEQADLISKPLRAQPELHHSFPISHTLHKHVPTSYGAVDPYISLHHDDDFNARGMEGATIVRTKPSRFKEPETVTQPQPRDLVVRPGHNEKSIEEYNNSSRTRNAGYDDPQYGDGNRHISTNPRMDHYEQWQPDHYNNTRPSLQNMEPQREAYNLSIRPTGQHLPKYNYSEVQYPLLASSDERHVVRSLLRSQEPQRYDLHKPMIQLGLHIGILSSQS